jgi:hypothetical protein
MSKILIVNSWIHDKNKAGLAKLLNYLLENQQINEYKIGSLGDILNYDIVYSSADMINTAQYPNQKFIFGPHVSMDPYQLHSLENHIHKNSVYIQPSEWVAQWWKSLGCEQFLPLKAFPFPVDTDKFCPNPETTIQTRENIFIYFKGRDPAELSKVIDFLSSQQITNYHIFSYRERYKESDYLTYLTTCKYGIILDAHESQGFAIEEALSCDVPLLVWSAKTMNQEYGSRYQPIPCTSIPYWDSRCGEYFHDFAELPFAFQTLQTKLDKESYNPRQYILDTLSTERCAERFMELIKF